MPFKSNHQLLIAFFHLLSDEPNGLQTSLGFVTGLDTIPSLGFDPSPRLIFHHQNPVDEYDGLPYMPYTNACANILTIPVLSDYDLFCVFKVHKIDFTNECHEAYFRILLLFRVTFKIIMVFELCETITSFCLNGRNTLTYRVSICIQTNTVFKVF